MNIKLENLDYSVGRIEEWDEWLEVVRDESDYTKYREGTTLWSLIRIKESMKKYGCTNPLIVINNKVIIGNQRLLGLRALDIKEVDCQIAADAAEVEKFRSQYKEVKY